MAGGDEVVLEEDLVTVDKNDALVHDEVEVLEDEADTMPDDDLEVNVDDEYEEDLEVDEVTMTVEVERVDDEDMVGL